MRHLWRAGLILLSLAWLPVVQAQTWRMVPSGSRLEFTATYEGQPAPGRFGDFTTVFHFDPTQPQSGRLHVTVTLGSVDMHSPDVNEAVVQPEWLDVEGSEPAEFTSERILRVQENRFVADGTLQLKGIERPVQVPFTWQRSGDRATMKGRITLRRTDFNIGTGQWSEPDPIALKVEIRFVVQLEARR